MDKDSMPYLFSFSRYGTKCIIDGVINFNIYLRSTSRAMADREKKNRRREIRKFEYFENEKELFR